MGVGGSSQIKVIEGGATHTIDKDNMYVVSDEPNYVEIPDADTIIHEWRTGKMSKPLYNYSRLLHFLPTRVIQKKTKLGLEKKKKYFVQGFVSDPEPFPFTSTVVSKVKHVRKTERTISKDSPSIKTIYHDPSVANVEETFVITRPSKRTKFEHTFFPKKEIRGDDLPKFQLKFKDPKGDVLEVQETFQDPNYPEHEIGVIRKPKYKSIVENDCTRYGVSQMSGTCHAYTPINILLLCEPLRNYTIKVMNGILSERKDIRSSISHEYAKESLTQITASAVYRRVCETLYGSEFAPQASSGVCFTSFFLGKKTENKGGYSEINLIMMMSSIGLRGVMNPSRTNTMMPADVSYILLHRSAKSPMPFDKHMFPGFTLIGALCKFKENPSGHVTAGIVCKDGSLILFDSNFGGYNLDWLSFANLEDYFNKSYGKGDESRELLNYFIFLSNSFIDQHSAPVTCGDAETLIHVKSLITVPEIRRVRSTYGEVITRFSNGSDLYTAPLYRLEKIIYP